MSDEKKKIDPGTHKVKVTKWGFRGTKAENMQFWARFSNGAVYFQNINSNETGDEILSRALVLMGFTGTDLPDLYKENALDTEREIEIYVQYKPNSETGEPQMSVNISDPSRGGIKGDLSKDDGLKMLKKLKLTLREQIAAASSEIEAPAKKDNKTKAKPDADSDPEDDDDIPF